MLTNMEHAGEFEFEAQIKIHLCFIILKKEVVIEILWFDSQIYSNL